MAVLWAWPVQPQAVTAGSPVTAAALTAGTPDPVPILPGQIYPAGARLRLWAQGELTSTSATPTVVLGFYFGAVGGAIGSAKILCASPALVINVAATAWPFIMEYNGTFRTLSSSVGVIHGTGYVKSGFGAAGGLAAQFTDFPMPITAALRTVSTLNTNQNNQLDVGITLSVTTGSPSVTITDFFAELVG